jgi:hypothetical protein
LFVVVVPVAPTLLLRHKLPSRSSLHWLSLSLSGSSFSLTWMVIVVLALITVVIVDMLHWLAATLHGLPTLSLSHWPVLFLVVGGLLGVRFTLLLLRLRRRRRRGGLLAAHLIFDVRLQALACQLLRVRVQWAVHCAGL